MSEEIFATVPFDRAVEQALVSLKKGAHLLKYGRRGKPKFCACRLSTDERFLIWYSGLEEKQLRISSITKIIRGQRTTNFQRQLQPEKEDQSFSIVYANGQHSLDLICKDTSQADSWCLGLGAIISRFHHSKSLGALQTRRGAQSCVNSPAGYMRRKHNMGLSEEAIKISQVRSLAGSPSQSISERCFSDGLSCSSDSFYSESSLSSMQNATDILIPNSPCIEPDCLRKRGMSSQGPSLVDKNILRDVLIWGEGAEGGFLGDGFDKFGKHNGLHSDALLPKLLESAIMLDVRTISLGVKHAALVTRQGEVFCWGDGSRGRLGNKVNMDVTYPKIVDSIPGVQVKSVICSEYQTCALTFAGELYTWGDDCYSSVLGGRGSKRIQWLPRRISGPLDGINVSQVACGEWHMAFVSTCGQLFTFGDGTFGVLGHGNLQSVPLPKEVESLKGLRVKSVACGPWHTAAVVNIIVDCYKVNDSSGKLFTWGDGDKGRLGHADQEKKLLPTCVAQLVDHDFVQVACGRMLTIALTCTGKVYTMGSDVHGELGNPLAKDKSITVVQGKLEDDFIREVSSGSYHVAVLSSNGRVYTWGRGTNGQLGLGDTIDRNAPVLVEALRDRQVESVTCGSNFTAAICVHKSVSTSDRSSCRGCGQAFGFTRKRHNCYNCGHLFCHPCSSKRVTNASLAPNKSKPYRVCDPCYKHLKRVMDSGRPPKWGNHCPRQLLTTQKAFPDEKLDKGEATKSPSQISLTRRACSDNSQFDERKNMKIQGDIEQPLCYSSSFPSGFPRWGQVSRPGLFEDCHEQNHVCRPEKQLPLSPLCSQHISLASKSPTSYAMDVDKGLQESDNLVNEEVQKLRTKVEILEKLCQTRSEKIQECKQRIEEAWFLAKEEAAKSKAAKEFIKALTLRLHKMSEKLYDGRELGDQVAASASPVAIIPRDSPTLKGINKLSLAMQLPPEVGSLEGRKVDSLCNSPIVFTNTLKSMSRGNFYNGGSVPTEDSIVRKTDCRQNTAKTSKLECVEKYEPGVYITFTTLPSGQKGLKRVRFSRKRFTEKEAEKWWEENQQVVYQKFEIERHKSSEYDDPTG
ncbi:hypothetical protein NMG60_11007640 [Bertholletia excelsa]